MKTHEIDQILRTTLDDMRLSRSEKQALGAMLEDLKLEPSGRAAWRNRAFALARETVGQASTNSAEAALVVGWLEQIVRTLEPVAPAQPKGVEVYFSPGDECRRCINRLMDQARSSVDICVFTITDDEVVEPIMRAFRRGVAVRIVTDDEKSYDLGSDAERLERLGIPVRFDRSEHHMHHKYAIFDGLTVLTGSYNWTRSAAAHNRENLVVIQDPELVAPFQENFAELWQAFAP